MVLGFEVDSSEFVSAKDVEALKRLVGSFRLHTCGGGFGALINVGIALGRRRDVV